MANASDPRRFLAFAAGGLGRAVALALALAAGAAQADTTLLNVSYDPTRELYKAVNAAFSADWKAKTGETVTIGLARRIRRAGAVRHRRPRRRRRDAGARRRHRRHRRQDRQDSGRLAEAAAAQFRRPTPRPSSSSCARATRRASTTGTISPSPASSVVTPNPKTSGGARWNYLAAWGYGAEEVRRRRGQDQGFRHGDLSQRARARHRRARLDHHLRPARHRRRADRLGERRLPRLEEFGKDQFDIVAPSQSILAEPPVSLVDGNIDAKGTRKVAEAYLKYLYTPEAQAIIAKNYFRPTSPKTPPRKISNASPRSTSSRSTGRSAAGRRRRRPTSPTAACSTRS